MNTVLLIRHGLTAGNLEKRYIGRTDEPLCQQGMEQAAALAPQLPACDLLFSSPMLRCRQTAAILFPRLTAQIVANLRESDFGVFEGRTAAELADNPAYAAWLDSGCLAAIPSGENVQAFKARCCNAFVEACSETAPNSTVAFVLHGGCVMAILERFAQPRRTFYDYHIGNCAYVVCTRTAEVLTITGGALC